MGTILYSLGRTEGWFPRGSVKPQPAVPTKFNS